MTELLLGKSFRHYRHGQKNGGENYPTSLLFTLKCPHKIQYERYFWQHSKANTSDDKKIYVRKTLQIVKYGWRRRWLK